MVVLSGVNTPVPPDHTAPVATVYEPFSVVTALFLHLVWSTPAFTVGDGVIVINISSLTAEQFPLPVVVSVKVTLPALISPAEGVYCVLSTLFPGTKVPVPPVHNPPVAMVTAPFNVAAGLFPHTVISLPAFAVGSSVKVITISSESGLHVP